MARRPRTVLITGCNTDIPKKILRPEISGLSKKL
jgi:hypothetical protein